LNQFITWIILPKNFLVQGNFFGKENSQTHHQNLLSQPFSENMVVLKNSVAARRRRKCEELLKYA
jgi:hypothetical protein